MTGARGGVVDERGHMGVGARAEWAERGWAGEIAVALHAMPHTPPHSRLLLQGNADFQVSLRTGGVSFHVPAALPR